MPSFLKPSAHSPILPLTHRASSPSPGSSSRNTLRSTSRRLSYNLKNRANRHAYPLAVAGLLAALYLYFTWYRTGYHSLTHGRKFHLYTRHQNPFGMKHGATPGTLGRGPGIVNGDRNRVSLLTANEEELIAEDDLYLQSYIEPAPLTPEETAAEQQLQAHREDVLELDRQHQLRALVWWLAEGGTFPRSWDVPTKSHLKKVGGRGMEKILDKVDQVKDGKDDEAMFPDGWADYAKSQYRVVVISKSYCPFSKRAKAILRDYHISPAPYIIEIDRRSDMGTIQTLLQRLTDRRTVPNILFDSVSIGGADELTLIHSEGGLTRQFEKMAVLPGLRRGSVPPPPPPPLVKPAVNKRDGEENGQAVDLKRDAERDEFGSFGVAGGADIDVESGFGAGVGVGGWPGNNGNQLRAYRAPEPIGREMNGAAALAAVGKMKKPQVKKGWAML